MTPETAEAITQAPAEPAAPAAPETPAPEAAPQEQAPETQTAPDGLSPELLSQIDQRFNSLRTELDLPPQVTPGEDGQQAHPVEQIFPAAAPPEEGDLPEGAEQQDEYQQYADPDEEARREVEEYLDRKAQEAAERQLQPFFETEQRRQRIEAAMQLEEEFPELRDGRVAGPVVQLGQGLLAEMGVPDAANHPGFAKFVKLIYMASKAEAAAASETPAGQDRDVALEQPGARAPQAGEQQPTEAQQIVQAGHGQGLFG